MRAQIVDLLNPRSILCTAMLALLLITVAAPVRADEYGVICGKPKKSGNVTMNVIVEGPGGSPQRVISVTLAIAATMTAEEKCYAFWVAFAAAKGDTVLPGHTGSTIDFVGQNGWTVIGTAMANDATGEPDRHLCETPFSRQRALFSLHNNASGLGADGTQGFARVTISGRTVVVPTSPGMPASVIEQQVMAQLNGQGVQTRMATAADFPDGLAALPHDSSVLWMQPLDLTGLEQEVNDTGLLMQLSCLLGDPPAAATDVAGLVPARAVQLAASPSPFSNDPVTMRYSAGESGSPAQISVFSATGRRVRELLAGSATSTGTVTWDGRDDRGERVPSGVYFVRLATPVGNAMQRVVRVGG